MSAREVLELRTRPLSGAPVEAEGRDYVLCWVMQALRAEHNPLLDAAIAWGNELDMPVVVIHAIENATTDISPWMHFGVLSPREAWAIACYLNDRLSLDGRDASTYGGIRWGFGEAKKGYRQIAIYGWVAPRSSGALRRRDGVPEWLAAQAARETFRVSLPEDEEAVLARYL